MKKRVLGRTGLEVGELSLGAAFVTGGEEGVAGALPVVRRALELGMNLADTSADYGRSERALGGAAARPLMRGDAARPVRPRGSDFDPKDNACLRKIVEQSLENLHRDALDILMIHEPDRPGQFDWYDDTRRFHGAVTELFEELKAEGVIRFTGLGGTTAYQLPLIMATGDYDVVLTAFNSSPLWREALVAVLPEAARRDMGVMLASPTQQGWLARRFDEEIEHGARWLSPARRAQFKELYAFVDELGIPIPVLCIRWALGVQGVSTVLTGPRNVEQLEQNFSATEAGPLPKGAMDRLDEIAAMVPFRPFEEPFGCRLGDPDYWGPGAAR